MTDVLHLYALTGAQPGPEPATALDDAPIRSIRSGPFHAIVTEHAHAPPATRDAAMTHARVIERLAPLVPTLPVRFGSSHTDEAALHGALAATRDMLAAALDHVGGHVEFSIHLLDPGTPAVGSSAEPAPDGRTYLERQLERRRAEGSHQRTVTERLTAATDELARVARATCVVLGRRGPERCFLVAMDHADEFAQLALQLAHVDTFEVTGPFPPFSFAGGPRP